MDKRVKSLPELTPEEFFDEKNSMYLRCTYDKEIGGYRVLIYNNMDVSTMEENEIKMAILVRGLAELAIEHPSEVFNIGYSTTMRDQIDLATNLTDEEKDLMKNPQGSA